MNYRKSFPCTLFALLFVIYGWTASCDKKPSTASDAPKVTGQKRSKALPADAMKAVTHKVPKGVVTSADAPYQPWRFSRVRLPPPQETVTFKVAVREAEEGFETWIMLAEAAGCIKRLKGADDIVLRAKEISIIVDYPMRHAWAFTLRLPSAKGLSRGELALLVSKVYSFIYKEESRTTKIKVGLLKGTYNRNRTDGKFQIYGHSIKDLGLEKATIHKTRGGYVFVRLVMNS